VVVHLRNRLGEEESMTFVYPQVSIRVSTAVFYWLVFSIIALLVLATAIVYVGWKRLRTPVK